MQNLPQPPKWVLILLLIVSFIGFVDTAYLSAKAFQGVVPTCIVFSGCDIVANSAYSHIAGFPIAYLGLGFYLMVLVLSIAYLDLKKIILYRIIGWVSIPAFLFSAWLTYVQFGILKALCIYCTVSALLSLIIVFLSNFYPRKEKVIPGN